MIYFIRHSQAGPRGNYDELSELGIRQAHHLGAYFAHQQIKFDKIYVGNLARQQLTASIVSSHLPNQSELITDERWNEFRLDPVYRTIAAKLSLEDEIFAQDFSAMQSMLSEDAYAMRGAVARCDRAVMQAWLAGRFPAEEHESWIDFQVRVSAAFNDLRQHDAKESIAVFTSATPIAIAVANALQLTDKKTLELAWIVQNSSLTTMKLRDESLHLYSFNATPHLTEESLRTFR
jgi:broad specificity phosphatase PhoE